MSEERLKTEIIPATNEELDVFVERAGQLFIDAQVAALQDLGFETAAHELEPVSVKVGPAELEQFDTLRDAKVAEVGFMPPAYGPDADNLSQPIAPAMIVVSSASQVGPGKNETTSRILQITHSFESDQPSVWDTSGAPPAEGMLWGEPETIHSGSGDTWQEALIKQEVDDAADQILGNENTKVSQEELRDWLGLLQGVVQPERLNFPSFEYAPEPKSLAKELGLIR